MFRLFFPETCPTFGVCEIEEAFRVLFCTVGWLVDCGWFIILRCILVNYVCSSTGGF